MNRREFLKGIGSLIGCVVGKIPQNGSDGRDATIAELEQQSADYRGLYEGTLAACDWWRKTYRELETWYHEVCHERDALKWGYESQRDRCQWLRERLDKYEPRPDSVYIEVRESNGIFEFPDGTIGTLQGWKAIHGKLPPLREPWPMTDAEVENVSLTWGVHKYEKQA